jgi:hypothetical protein
MDKDKDSKTNKHSKKVVDNIIALNTELQVKLNLSSDLYEDIFKLIEGGKYVERISVVEAIGVLELIKIDLAATTTDNFQG